MKTLSEKELRDFHRRPWKYAIVLIGPVVVFFIFISAMDLWDEKSPLPRLFLTIPFSLIWLLAVYISSWYFQKCPACAQQLPRLKPGRCPSCFTWLGKTPESQLPSSADNMQDEAISKSSIPRRLQPRLGLFFTFIIWTVILLLWISAHHTHPGGMPTFGIVLLVGSAGILVVAIYVARRTTLRIMREGKLIQAEVTDIWKTRYSSQAYVKYRVEGTAISTKCGISRDSTLKPGDKVPIFIDPKDPAKIVIASDAPYRVV